MTDDATPPPPIAPTPPVHRVRLFVGASAALAPFLSAMRWPRAFALTPGANFPVLVFDDEAQDALHLANGTGDWPEGVGHTLSTRDLAFAAAASRAAPLAYLETDYEGAEGTQAAALWFDGALTIAPIRIDTATALLRPPSVWPINAALRGLGFRAVPPDDEFTSFGLKRWSSNSEIRAHARPVR